MILENSEIRLISLEMLQSDFKDKQINMQKKKHEAYPIGINITKLDQFLTLSSVIKFRI